MKRQIALTVTLLHLLGTAGVPVVAYTCVESGEVGVVPYLASSPDECYAESCCEEEVCCADEGHGAECLDIHSDVPCCDVSAPMAQDTRRVSLPDKVGAADVAGAVVVVDDSLLNARCAHSHESGSMFFPSISLPLLA